MVEMSPAGLPAPRVITRGVPAVYRKPFLRTSCDTVDGIRPMAGRHVYNTILWLVSPASAIRQCSALVRTPETGAPNVRNWRHQTIGGVGHAQGCNPFAFAAVERAGTLKRPRGRPGSHMPWQGPREAQAFTSYGSSSVWNPHRADPHRLVTGTEPARMAGQYCSRAAPRAIGDLRISSERTYRVGGRNSNGCRTSCRTASPFRIAGW